MSTTSYNPHRVAKLLDLAGHAATPDNEALVAVRMAYTTCTKAGMTLADAMVVDADIFFKLNTVPVHAYLARIADLEEADAAKDAKIAELEAANVVLTAADAAKDAQLADKDAHVAALQERLREQHDCGQQQRDEAPLDEDASSATITIEHADLVEEPVVVEVEASMRPLRWTRSVIDRLTKCVTAGMSKARIARLLMREFGRLTTIAKVAEMMRARWQPDADGYLWAS